MSSTNKTKKQYGPYGTDVVHNQEIYYPTLVYKDITFKSFSELKEYIIKRILPQRTSSSGYYSQQEQTTTTTNVKMYELNEIKEKIYGMKAKDIPNYYDSKIKSLYIFISNINLIIAKYSKDGKIGGNRDVNLRYKFKKYRNYQPKCEGDRFFIPGFFTSSSKRYTDDFKNESSSSANKKIYNSIKICLEYLKKIMVLLLRYSLGESYDKYKNSIDSLIDYEFKLKDIDISNNVYKYSKKSEPSISIRHSGGGSKKKLKQNNVSRSRVLKYKTVGQTKKTLKRITKKNN
jgi:hypothetical protein